MIDKLKTLIEIETGREFNRANKIYCPFHHEKTPSFSIYEDEAGKAKFKCFGCGENGDAIDFIKKYKNLNYSEADKYLKSQGIESNSNDIVFKDEILSYIDWQIQNLPDMKEFKLKEIYEFRDYKGKVRYYKAKFKTDTGKQCRYYSITNNKVKNERNGKEIPYNLYKLIKSKSNTVYIVEGEKDTDTLSKLGFTAVSLKGFKFDKFHCRFFKNKDIIIIPDNDDPGEKYRDEVIRGLKPYIKSYKVFPIGDYSKISGQDITDLFEANILDKSKFKQILNEIKGISTYLDNKEKLIPVRLARLIVMCEDIIYTKKEGFFHYEDGYYKLKDDTEMKALVSNYLQDILNIDRNKSEILSHIKENVIEEIRPNNGYLNFRNCLLKVTKEGIGILEHTPDIVTTNRFNYDYTEVDYRNSNYFRGLKYALNDDLEMVKFLQQFAGACLMPNAPLMKRGLIITGPKGTGKSTFIEPIQEMMSGLFESYDLKTLEDDKYILSYLANKKCILSTDDSGRSLETCHRLKKLIYGESVPTDRKFKDAVSLNLNLAIIIGLNDIPQFKDDSNAIFDRFEFVEFNKIIRGTEKDDPLFIDSIKKKEMQHVINFALDGLLELLRNNYKVNAPNEVKELKEKIKSSNNPFESWFHDCVEKGSSNDFSTLKDLYNSYLGYCLSELSLDEKEAKKECGKQQMNKILQSKSIKFGRELKRAGIKHKSVFFGVKLNKNGKEYFIQ